MTLVRIAALSALVACDGPTSSTPDDDTGTPLGNTAAPDTYGEPGEWHAGTFSRTIIGSDGLPLTLQVWYPSTQAGASPVTYDGLLLGDAYEGVTPDCAVNHPVLAFSHGHGGVRYQSPFFTEHLATHGWVVVAPDHRGNTFLDDSGDVLELMVRRPVDLADAFDALASDPTVGQCVTAADGYAVAGHSFGGYTAFVDAGATINLPPGAVHDERVWAVLAFAPWDGAGVLTDGTKELKVPTMVLTGALDETTPIEQVRALWDPIVIAPRWLGVFGEAGHYSFSPVACLVNDGDGCGDGFLDSPTFTRLVNTATLAFLLELRGVPGAEDAIPTDAPEITWEQ